MTGPVAFGKRIGVENESEFKRLQELRLANRQSIAATREALVQLENRIVVPRLGISESTPTSTSQQLQLVSTA
jgi:hypothetical protein